MPMRRLGMSLLFLRVFAPMGFVPVREFLVMMEGIERSVSTGI